MDKTIDLINFIAHDETALVGRENGENVLGKIIQGGLDFKKLEKSFDKIIINIPDHVVSINKSFFLGLFETSVLRLGKEGFLNKYKFVTSDHIINKIKSHIDAALLTASQGEILDV